jgi:hypothetical protein
MSQRGDKNRREGTATSRNYMNPRQLALVGLEALANYKEAGLAQPGETMHRQLAIRLARITATNKWG